MTMLFADIAAVHPLATVNAVLNATATILLVLGYVQIKARKERAHKWTMLTAFAVSIAFLICYLAYHALVGHVKFTGPSDVQSVYYTILISHVFLAALVPFLALRTIYLGLKDDRPRHRWWAKRTFPIWLYVSVTGVIIYLMLYVIYPGPAG